MPIDEWEILYWDENNDNPIGKWLDDLTKDQYKCVAKELFLLRKCGNLLRIPHSKPLEDGLFELREMHFGYRVYYAFFKGKVIVLLQGGDKSSQSRDIKIAKKRLSRLKEDQNAIKKLSRTP